MFADRTRSVVRDMQMVFRSPIREKVVSLPEVELAMNVDSIRAYCLSFSDATEKLQWGDALCFKVRAKMFAVLGLDRVRLTFKCSPETFAELVEREGIHPAPYVGRYHWVMLDRLDLLGREELRNLIGQSYEMVAANAPKSKARLPKQETTQMKKREIAPKTRKKH
jgi:predicted DNA-binding protein (MmcQ/YjbR family)